MPNRDVSNLYRGTPEADGIESLAVNGENVTPEIQEGYAIITRHWKPSDKIQLELPLRVQRVRADERIVADRGRVALRYGPLVYNIESVDGNNPDGVLEPDAELTTEWRPDLLGGMLVIRGQFADGSPLLAIPNYARNNRLSAGRRANGNRADGDSESGFNRSRFRGGGQSLVWIRDQ